MSTRRWVDSECPIFFWPVIFQLLHLDWFEHFPRILVFIIWIFWHFVFTQCWVDSKCPIFFLYLQFNLRLFLNFVSTQCWVDLECAMALRYSVIALWLFCFFVSNQWWVPYYCWLVFLYLHLAWLGYFPFFSIFQLFCHFVSTQCWVDLGCHIFLAELFSFFKNFGISYPVNYGWIRLVSLSFFCTYK